MFIKILTSPRTRIVLIIKFLAGFTLPIILAYRDCISSRLPIIPAYRDCTSDEPLLHCGLPHYSRVQGLYPQPYNNNNNNTPLSPRTGTVHLIRGCFLRIPPIIPAYRDCTPIYRHEEVQIVLYLVLYQI